MATTITAPAGFTAVAAAPDGIEFSGLHMGPTCGTVTTAWSPEEGTLVYVGDSEGMSVEAAHQLLADLRDALGRVEGL